MHARQRERWRGKGWRRRCCCQPRCFDLLPRQAMLTLATARLCGKRSTAARKRHAALLFLGPLSLSATPCGGGLGGQGPLPVCAYLLSVAPCYVVNLTRYIHVQQTTLCPSHLASGPPPMNDAAVPARPVLRCPPVPVLQTSRSQPAGHRASRTGQDRQRIGIFRNTSRLKLGCIGGAHAPSSKKAWCRVPLCSSVCARCHQAWPCATRPTARHSSTHVLYHRHSYHPWPTLVCKYPSSLASTSGTLD